MYEHKRCTMIQYIMLVGETILTLSVGRQMAPARLRRRFFQTMPTTQKSTYFHTKSLSNVFHNKFITLLINVFDATKYFDACLLAPGKIVYCSKFSLYIRSREGNATKKWCLYLSIKFQKFGALHDQIIPKRLNFVEQHFLARSICGRSLTGYGRRAAVSQ